MLHELNGRVDTSLRLQEVSTLLIQEGNLDALYEYMCQRIMQANAQNKPEWLDEVSRLLNEIRSAWLQMPQANGRVAGR